MKIEHVALWCKDLEEMREFYEMYFLASSNELYTNETKGFSSYFLSFPNSTTRLELMSRTNITESKDKEMLGLAHLAFKVENADVVNEMTAIMIRAGIKHIDGPRQTGDGYYESTILDPEGNIIEITC